jgi:small subunit ribosomal protein S1
VGDKVTGTVFQIENNGLYVDIGAKSSAFCPVAELTLAHDMKARSSGTRS